jgi:formate hydrogenlyase subunit 3/multisubunit Na+/H+ antiporter MnhD subunit
MSKTGLVEMPLVFSAVRCTGQYIALPLMLPLLGVATGVTPGIMLILDGLAAIAIAVTVLRLWRTQHSRRWHYLPVALALAAMIGLLAMGDSGVL